MFSFIAFIVFRPFVLEDILFVCSNDGNGVFYTFRQVIFRGDGEMQIKPIGRPDLVRRDFGPDPLPDLARSP